MLNEVALSPWQNTVIYLDLLTHANKSGRGTLAARRGKGGVSGSESIDHLRAAC